MNYLNLLHNYLNVSNKMKCKLRSKKIALSIKQIYCSINFNLIIIPPSLQVSGLEMLSFPRHYILTLLFQLLSFSLILTRLHKSAEIEASCLYKLISVCKIKLSLKLKLWVGCSFYGCRTHAGALGYYKVSRISKRDPIDINCSIPHLASSRFTACNQLM